MDSDQQFNSLLKWVQTLPTSAKVESSDDLSDGVVMAEILTQIAPSFFDTSWQSKIKMEVHDNWRLKVSNLKKILKAILDYYTQVLGLQIIDFHLPDVNLIGEREDQNELTRLLQLILGCAVNCDNKQDYIESIMKMEETVQHVVMRTIQELMTKEAEGPSVAVDSEERAKKYEEELSKLADEKDELVRRCHDLDQQVEVLQIEKTSLVSENESLNEKLNEGDSLDDPVTPGGRRLQQIQQKLDQVQEECYRIEASRDDYRIRVELQEKEILELQHKCDEFSKLAEEVPHLKDEMDVLRSSQEKVDQMESTLETYRRKLEDHGDVRRQLKLLEERNTEYLQKFMDQDEELRKVSTLKNQVDVYKRQVQELHIKLSEETKRADRSEFEKKRSEEKLGALKMERDRLQDERNSLKEGNEELKLSLLQKENEIHGVDTSPSSPTVTGVDILDMMPPEIKERYVKLQHENRILHSQQDENTQILQGTCDDLNGRVAELETENRIANQRMLELECQLEDLSEVQSVSGNVTSAAGDGMRKELQEKKEELKRLGSEMEDNKVKMEELQAKLAQYESRITDLDNEVRKRDDEIEVMQTKYKRYLEQAKAVICALDPRHNARGHPEVTALRQQLQERDRRISLLEKDADKSKALHDEEKNMMMSAWYNLSGQLHRQSTEERLSHLRSPLAGQSFLARQRQVSRRMPPMTTSMPSSTMVGTTHTTSGGGVNNVTANSSENLKF